MRITGRIPSGLRVAGVLLITAVVAACAASYYFFVDAQRQYFAGRNFRLLGTIATQLDNSFRTEASVLAALAGDEKVYARVLANPPGEEDVDVSVVPARTYVEALTDAWVQRRPRYSANDVTILAPQKPVANSEPRYGVSAGPDAHFEVHLRPRGQPAQVRVEDSKPFARLRIDGMLAPIFAPKIAPATFDTIVLATQNGDVVYAAGSRAHELKVGGLASLLPQRPEINEGRRAFRSTEVHDVAMSGVDYRLYTQPCCVPTLASGQPLVLAGLVEADLLRSQSWAISTTLVKLVVMAMLIALIAWPFLKLELIGDRQKVRVSDFLQLGVSSVAGLAILTVAILDFVAYRQLNRDTDQQLVMLADSIDRHATEEIAHAYRQLRCLERQDFERIYRPSVASRAGAIYTQGSVLSRPEFSCATDPADSPGAAGTNAWPYPFFETFALIDTAGMQRVKAATTESVPTPIPVRGRPYFQLNARGRGWQHDTMCPPGSRCTFESIWSWTTGEPLAVLAKEHEPARAGASPALKVAALTIYMRSLIRAVLPPGFEFAVIDRGGKVLFHSDRQRNTNENFLEETDDNRRLRAQVAAHRSEPVNIRYWGAAYRAYVKPMALPETYVVTLSQKPRMWALNQEWLVVTMFFLSGYLILWFGTMLVTLSGGAAWIWPDAARRRRYHGVMALCAALLVTALAAAWFVEKNGLVLWAVALPLAGWVGAYIILKKRPAAFLDPSREPVVEYSMAAILLLIVSGVVPGALLFLASFQLHAQSYIKNSQLLLARQLSQRDERLAQEYADERGKGKGTARHQIDPVSDRDLYFDFLYDTCISQTRLIGEPADSCAASAETSGSGRHAVATSGREDGGIVLAFLEDYLPYYSEASVEWRELLHDRADDRSWFTGAPSSGASGIQPPVPAAADSMQPGPGQRLTMTVAPPGAVPITLTSRVPTIYGAAGVFPAGQDRALVFIMLASGLGILVITWGIVHIFMRHVFLVGVTEPLWASVKLAVNAGDNTFVICDERTKARQLEGTVPLKLGPIARERDIRAAWRKALIGLDRRNQAGGAVLVDDFDEDFEDTAAMSVKLMLLEELVADSSRTVVLLSELSPSALSDGLRHATPSEPVPGKTNGENGQGSAPVPCEAPGERWRRVLEAFVLVEWRDLEIDAKGAPTAVSIQGPAVVEPLQGALDRVAPPTMAAWSARAANRFAVFRMGPVCAFLDSEARSHPYVRRVCAELRQSEAVQKRRLTMAQAFDEIAERTAQCYRSIWSSCSEDEKVVVAHIAQHGLANASARTVVRRLLARRLLYKDPALRPMNETFRRFVLSKECGRQVAVLESAGGPSTWDRLRAPLAVCVVTLAVFLFSTQRELYNAILGITTAAAVSVPTLIRAVGMLAGRRTSEEERA